MTKVTIVTACYNQGRYLSDMINSLLGGATSIGVVDGQTLRDFDCIIVDDNSTDDTQQFIRRIKHPQLKTYRLEHSFPGNNKPGALNFGISKAKGEYIAIVDSDDLMESWRLKALVDACEQNPRSFAYDDIREFANGLRTTYRPMPNYNFPRVRYHNLHCGLMFPKAAWEECGGYPEEMRHGREDLGFLVKLGVRGWCGAHVERMGYLYRREGQNRSLLNSSPEWLRRFMAQLKDLFPEAYYDPLPLGCCGSGYEFKSPTTRLKFVANGGNRFWKRPHGELEYYFGGSRRYGIVLKEDADWLLLRRERGQQIFDVAE